IYIAMSTSLIAQHRDRAHYVHAHEVSRPPCAVNAVAVFGRTGYYISRKRRALPLLSQVRVGLSPLSTLYSELTNILVPHYVLLSSVPVYQIRPLLTHQG